MGKVISSASTTTRVRQKGRAERRARVFRRARYLLRRAPIPTRRSSRYIEAIRPGAFGSDGDRDAPCPRVQSRDRELVPPRAERRGILERVDRRLAARTRERRRELLPADRVPLLADDDREHR